MSSARLRCVPRSTTTDEQCDTGHDPALACLDFTNAPEYCSIDFVGVVGWGCCVSLNVVTAVIGRWLGVRGREGNCWWAVAEM